MLNKLSIKKRLFLLVILLVVILAISVSNIFFASQDEILIIGICVTVALTLLSVFVVIGIGKILNASFKSIAKEVNEIALGNLNVKFTSPISEFEELSNSLTDMTKTLKLYIGETSRILTLLAKNDLNVEVKIEFKGNFVEIKNVLETIIANFNSIIKKIAIISEQVDLSSKDIADGAKLLADGSQEQASAIIEFVASIESITSQMETGLSLIEEEYSASKEIANSSKTARENSLDLEKAMLEIQAIAKDITKITKLLEENAMQTKILALNAAIEAARAGESGKGFSIVADEVKVLSNNNDESAKEASTLIGSSRVAIERGTKFAKGTEEELMLISDSTQKSAVNISEIMASYEEQEKEILALQKALGQISDVIQSNSATAEESSAKSEELFNLADSLKKLVDLFRLK